MSEYNREEQLKQLHKDRRKTTDAKANAAIDALLKEKRPVNFHSVSEFSGISVATLYNHTTIRERIEHLRAKEKMLPSPKKAKVNMTDESKDAVLASLNRKLKRLEEENRKLNKLYQEYLASKLEDL